MFKVLVPYYNKFSNLVESWMTILVMEKKSYNFSFVVCLLRKRSYCVSRANACVRACVSEIPKRDLTTPRPFTLFPLTYILHPPSLLFSFALPPQRKRKEAQVLLRLTFSGMNYLALRVAPDQHLLGKYYDWIILRFQAPLKFAWCSIDSNRSTDRWYV